MKNILILIFIFFSSFSYAQTKKVEISAVDVTYNGFYNKAFVLVNEDDLNYPNSLLQLNPYTGIVEKHLPLNGTPIKMELTPDKKHIYVSYYLLYQIDKINIESFSVIETISLGNKRTVDFAVSPVDENILFVSRYLGTPDLVMIKSGEIQPKQVTSNWLYMSCINVMNDGSMLYVNDGVSTGQYAYLMHVVDDGIEYDGIEWRGMGMNFGGSKNNNGLIYGHLGTVVDAFSDSIPITKAMMPIDRITDNNTGFQFSPVHNCYVFGHAYDYHGYISFFHGQYYNYLGSVEIDFDETTIFDLSVVDVNHFILLAWETTGKRSIIFHYMPDKRNSSNENSSKEYDMNWYKNYDLINVNVKNERYIIQDDKK